MKTYLAILIFALITTVSFGQNNYEDVVYLKNGNIIRGTITEQVINKSLKIETADKNIFIYQIDEIEKITKEHPKYKSPELKSNEEKVIQDIAEAIKSEIGGL